MKTITKGWLLAFVLTLSTVLVGQSHATHARFGHFSWEARPEISPTTVDFRLEVAFRRSYFGNLQLGQTFRPGTFYFGDGGSASYNFEVIALNTQEDWVIGRAVQTGGDPGVVRHTYAKPAKSNGEPWQAYMSVCCRISSLRNSADTNFYVRTDVNLTVPNSSPVSSLPPIVSCPRGNCRFSVPVLDRDGDKIRWSLTPLGESGIRQNPAGLTVDPNTGLVDWVAGSAGAALGLYAVSVKIEDLDENDHAKSSVVTDFIINLQDFVNNQPPTFDHPPTPASGSEVTAIVGQELIIEVQATDADLNDQVFLNNLGLPPAAQFDTVTVGNPAVAHFRWTPEMKHIGNYLVTFTANDQKAASALPLPVKINVIKPAISDVRVINRVSAVDIDVERSSFSVLPEEVRVEDDKSIIEWRYPTFEVGQVENLNFDLSLKSLLPGETRLVIHDLEMTYKDVNGNQIREQLGSRAVAVSETVLGLTTATDRIQYKAGETVQIVSSLINLDDGDASGLVTLSIVDSGGNLVANLGSFTEKLSSKEARELSGKNFEVGKTLAGSYQVVAELTNAVGKVVATAQAPFSIVTDNGTGLNLASTVYSDKPVYGAWDTVAIAARLQNVAANALVGETLNEITVTAPDGTVLLHESRPVSSLAANAVLDFNFQVSLSDASAGSYQISWITRDAKNHSQLAQSQAVYTVERVLMHSIMGTVATSQAQIFHTGTNSCSYTVENRSRTPAGSVEFAYSLIHLDTEQVVQHHTRTLELDANGRHEWQQPIKASGLLYGGYGCVLEANLDGRWQVMSSAGFEVLPPKMTSDLAVGARGRLLVLADQARQCSALEDVRFEMNFDADLSRASRIQVKLYDHNRVLLDTQSVSQFDVELNTSAGNSREDLAVKVAAGGQVEAFIRAGGKAHLGTRYIIEVEVQRSLFITSRKEWSVDTTCDRPFTLGELHEDARLLGYRPWRGQDDVRTADPFGPLAAPDVEEQERFLKDLLAAHGWEYTLVHTAEDFKQEHRSGGYSVYALLSERPMLSVLVQKELREAVFNGAGLVVAGAHDKRNGWIEPALGVRVVGRHPWSTTLSMADSGLSSAWTETLTVSDSVQAIHLHGAQRLGEYGLVGDSILSQWLWLDRGSFELSDLFNFKRWAVTTHSYGYGKSVYAGFDLLMEATAAGLYSSYAELLMGALNHVHPMALAKSQASVVPLMIHLNNDRGATSGRAILHLPAGGELVTPGEFQWLNDQWVWDFSVPEQDGLAARVYVRLPAQASLAKFELSLATDIQGQYLQQQGQSLTVPVTAMPAMDGTLETLDALAWRYWYRLDYRTAHVKFKLAREAVASGHWLTAQGLLITTADLLMSGNEESVQQARRQVDEHIRSVGLQLNAR